jgi:hypothetical protein
LLFGGEPGQFREGRFKCLGHDASIPNSD